MTSPGPGRRGEGAPRAARAGHPRAGPARRPRRCHRPGRRRCPGRRRAARAGRHRGHVLAAASIGQVISNITKWVVGILAGLATLFLTLGGVRYLMAGGDPGEVERAKTAVRSAAIGYGLAILAPVIVTVLKSLVGG